LCKVALGKAKESCHPAIRGAHHKSELRRCDPMNAIKLERTPTNDVSDSAMATAVCSEDASKVIARVGSSDWEEKMAGLEAIHEEIAPQVNALRLAVEQDDADALNAEFELSVLISGR
jgi:hypothetical protein